MNKSVVMWGLWDWRER